MAFEKLNEVDLQILRDIYDFAKRCENIKDLDCFQEQVELLLGDVESPVLDWQKYMNQLEEMYDNCKRKK